MSATALALLAVAAAALALLFVLDRVAVGMLRPARRPPARDPSAAGLPFREWTVPGDPPLEAWEIPGRDPAGPVVILVHGWGGNAAVLLPLARAVVDRARRVVAVDIRGHGRSDDAPRVSLRQFRDDVLRVVAAAPGGEEAGGPATPVVVVGHSMGGAAAVLAAERSRRIAGIVLVAAPCDIFGTVARYLSERGLPGGLLVPLTRPFFRVRVGVSERELSPARAMGEVECAVCVIQPADDTRVPPSEGRRLAALSGTEMRLVRGAGHTDILDHPETADLLRDFLREPRALRDRARRDLREGGNGRPAGG